MSSPDDERNGLIATVIPLRLSLCPQQCCNRLEEIEVEAELKHLQAGTV